MLSGLTAGGYDAAYAVRGAKARNEKRDGSGSSPMSTTIGVGRGEAIAGARSAAPSRAIPVPSAARRNAGLDALRAALTLLVLFHHTAITCGAMGAWYYREAEPDRAPGTVLLIFFCTVNQAFFMGLFFLIAGYFMPAAAERHGAWAFLRERALRLGIPILAFSLFIGPLAIVLAQSVNPASAAAVAQSVKGLALGERLLLYWHLGLFGVGPLWFTAALLVFSFVYVAWRALASRLPTLRRPAATRAFPSISRLPRRRSPPAPRPPPCGSSGPSAWSRSALHSVISRRISAISRATSCCSLRAASARRPVGSTRRPRRSGASG